VSNAGLQLGADEHGTLMSQWRHGVMVLGYKAVLTSDAQGGKHQPRGAHSGQHEFEGVNTASALPCLGKGNCFMKFRANDDAGRDWGQPRVYSYLTGRLREGDPRKAPWELNAQAEVTFDHGEMGTARLTLAAGEGAALSKALVYYHRLNSSNPSADNGWREAPNLFNPYWRAKLHPFTAEQAAQVLLSAGNSDAARLVQSSPGLSL
jgi:hypothetical protein